MSHAFILDVLPCALRSTTRHHIRCEWTFTLFKLSASYTKITRLINEIQKCRSLYHDL